MSKTIGDDYVDEDTEETETPEFPEFSKELQEKLKILNGSAFFKDEFSLPQALGLDNSWSNDASSMYIRHLYAEGVEHMQGGFSSRINWRSRTCHRTQTMD